MRRAQSPSFTRRSTRTTEPEMATIRVLTENDIPGVTALFARVYPDYRWRSQTALESYFAEMLFDNPWRDLALPSWVAEEDGRISGCYAVIARPMVFRGRPIRVAVGCQAMVDPDRRHSFTVLQLVKACISGPQDLTLADGATDQSRRAWLGIGGAAPLLNSLHWIRPLRPARYALSLLEERAAFPRLLTLAARPLAGVADALALRLHPNRLLREESELVDETLDPATMLAHLPDVVRSYALQPVYDARTLAWLLEQAALKTPHGTLRARVVRDGHRRVIGWYLYYLRAGSAGEVIQIAAVSGAFDHVLRRLLADAWRQGVAALRGRIDPRHAKEFCDRHCWLRTDGTWTLVHSRHPDIMAAIHQGDAFLSRLEGEWWMRFLAYPRWLPGMQHPGVGATRPRPAATGRAQVPGGTHAFPPVVD